MATVYRELEEWLDERQNRFIAISDEIWANPELALAEFKACQLQADSLAEDGFTITRNVGGLPTAFMAEYTQGEGGPKIGFPGEYDALPGLSQKKVAVQDPLVADGPGHGCGHNMLGTASLAAAVTIKAWLQHTGKAGTVRYYGCPAEETGEGKGFMARAGAFDDLDAALTWHPGAVNTASAGSSLAVNNIKYRFKGRTAHAAANPETGRSALDAVELMSVGVNYLREHMPDAARIHYVITNGGGAPNVVPDEAEVWYFIRSPERYQVDELTVRVRNIAEGAALMTETKLTEVFLAGSYNMLSNQVLAERMQAVIDELGPIEFDAAELEYAKQVAAAFPESLRVGMMKAFKLPVDLIDAGLPDRTYPISDRGETMPGSTDVSDVSWNTPTAQFTTTTFPLATPGHSWANTSTGGMSIGHKGMIHAAKVLSIVASDLIEQPDLLAAARAEFEESTRGRPYVCPIPADVQPRQV
ncbi:MAG: amidohydrolase [Thermomicrobiales bacterium]|nr:amidohydrolase [Thermomicrobiales bacterium]